MISLRSFPKPTPISFNHQKAFSILPFVIHTINTLHSSLHERRTDGPKDRETDIQYQIVHHLFETFRFETIMTDAGYIYARSSSDPDPHPHSALYSFPFVLPSPSLPFLSLLSYFLFIQSCIEHRPSPSSHHQAFLSQFGSTLTHISHQPSAINHQRSTTNPPNSPLPNEQNPKVPTHPAQTRPTPYSPSEAKDDRPRSGETSAIPLSYAR